MREKIKQIQKKVGATPDGVVGPETVAAIMAALGIKDDTPLAWPTQKEVRSGKSIFGAPGSGKLVRITPPYQLWYDGGRVCTIAVHERNRAALRQRDAVAATADAVRQHLHARGHQALHPLLPQHTHRQTRAINLGR